MERFSRIERLIGTAGLQRLQRALVVVAGLGAVGSYAVEGLTRAGVGRLRIVDFDVIRPSNLNRQLFALESTLGQAKVEAATQRIRDINPSCAVQALRCFIHADTIEAILADSPDAVVDAIDSLAPKVALLAAVQRRKIPVISSMGAARHWDATLIRSGPLNEVQGCPLARLVRKRLRQEQIAVDFPCVYSLEKVTGRVGVPQTAPETEFYERGRARQPMGSLPTITGIFGLTAANWVINHLLQD